MYINRNKKPGLVKRIENLEWISFGLLAIFIGLLLVIYGYQKVENKVKQVKENYTNLWTNDAEQDRRLDKLEGK